MNYHVTCDVRELEKGLIHQDKREREKKKLGRAWQARFSLRRQKGKLFF